MIQTLACIVGLLLTGGVEEEAWREPAAATASLSDAVVRVPMDHASRRIEVPVRIDGHGPYLFQLDTSCESALVLDPELAAELSAPGDVPAAERAVGADGSGIARSPAAIGATRISRLELGEAGFLDVAAHVRPLGEEAAAGVRGVLGLPLFENLLLTIDYARSELVLSRGSLPRDAADVFPLLGPGSAPHVPLQVGGTVWPARIDTGDPENVTFPARAAGEVHTQRPPVVQGGRTRRDEPRVSGARLCEPLIVAGRGYQQLPVLFADDAEEPRLGYGLLTHYVLTFDQRQQLVRFGLSAPSDDTLAREAAAPTVAGGSGTWTAAHGLVGDLLP